MPSRKRKSKCLVRKTKNGIMNFSGSAEVHRKGLRLPIVKNLHGCDVYLKPLLNWPFFGFFNDDLSYSCLSIVDLLF